MLAQLVSSGGVNAANRPILRSPRHVHLAYMLHALWAPDLLGAPEPSACRAGHATRLCLEPAEALECLDALCRGRRFLQPLFSRQKAALRITKEVALREFEPIHDRRHDGLLGDL